MRRGAYDAAAGVACVPVSVGSIYVVVNAYLVAKPGGGWVLVDAVLGRASAGYLRDVAARRFGTTPPDAIVLTHGHFDHVGGLVELAAAWDVPVYAHRLERPYLTGRSAYPPYDPTTGGFSAQSSRFFPNRPVDVGDRLVDLPNDGSIPPLPGWAWVETPGHTPGHVSIFRESDRTLIAGDAIITQNQESAADTLSLRPVLHGPPIYATTDWRQAARSTATLAELRPVTLATGHGVPIRGASVAEDVRGLADDFERRAVPPRGRYVGDPAQFDQTGPTYVPPPVADPLPKALAVGGVATLAAGLLLRRARRG